MPFVRKYMDLDTNLEGLYTDIVKELELNKDLEIVKENDGVINNVYFRSVTAIRASIPRRLSGTLREVTVTIAGTPDNWLLEIHTGAWFGNLVVPGTGGFLIAGPIGATAAVSTTAIMAVSYGRKLKNRIKVLVKKHSGKKYTDEKVETFVS